MFRKIAVAGMSLLFAQMVMAEMPDKFVEYIESDGTQYIDIGEVLSADTRATIDFELQKRSGSYYNIFGSQKKFAYITWDWLYVYGNRIVKTCALNTRYHVQFDTAAQTIVINDEVQNLVAWSGSEGSATAESAYLFWGKGSTENKAIMRLYSCTVEQGGSDVRRLYPCVKDGVAGLYDAVNEEILYAAVGNAFATGAEIDTPPGAGGYVRVVGDPANIGAPQPGYGYLQDPTAGTRYQLYAPAVVTDDIRGFEYRCAGWELVVNGTVTSNTTENVTNCTYDCVSKTDKARLTWIWTPTKAQKIVRYVTPSGAGLQDGASWASAMKSLATAYAEVGAHPAGGTVYLAGGFYISANGNFVKDGRITMTNNVTVIGAADGKPTVISGDRSINDYWSKGSDYKIWTANGDGTYTYNPPPVGYYRQIGPNNDAYLFERGAGSAVSNRFENLTFNGFNQCVFFCADGRTDGLVIKNCKFLGNGDAGNHGNALVQTANSDLTLENCVFEGNFNGVRSSGDVVHKLVARNCSFNQCMGCWNGDFPGGIRLVSATEGEITGCSFVRTWMSTGNINGVPSAALGVSAGSQPVVISNCTFEANQPQSMVRGAVVIRSTSTVEVRDSRFINNDGMESSNINSMKAAALCIEGNFTHALVEGCYFAGNTITNLTANSVSTPAALTVGWGGERPTEIVNCTFERNVSIATNATGASWCSAVSLNTLRGCVVNCLFHDNVCGLVDPEAGAFVRTAEAIVPPLLYGSDTGLFMNDVFANAAHATFPIKTPYSRCSVLHCLSEGASKSAWEPYTGSDLGFYQEPVYSDTVRLSSVRTNEAGTVVARGLGNGNVRRVRYMGRLVLRANDGWFYYYDDGKLYKSHGKHWHRCCDLRSVAAVADEDAAALGLSLDAACHPDAFGQARVAGKISPGPLNAVPDGLMLLVR